MEGKKKAGKKKEEKITRRESKVVRAAEWSGKSEKTERERMRSQKEKQKKD